MICVYDERKVKGVIMLKLRSFAAGFLCLFVLFAGGCRCSEPKAPKEKTVVSQVESMTPEKIELVEKKDKDTYVFRSQVRDLTFEVKPKATTMSLDGSVFGYTGDFTYKSTYWDEVYASYQTRIEKTIADHGFKIEKRSREDMTYISNITIAAYNWLSDKNLDNINDFYRDLRDIAKEEERYHDRKSDFSFKVRFEWIDIWGDQKSYILTRGNKNFDTEITSDTPDNELDIRKLGVTEDRLAKASTPAGNGVLIVIEEDIV